MRARDDGKRVPCVYCAAATAFVRDRVGRRGGLTEEPCCPECGEQPARRAKPAQAAA